uniref:Uncharacterized protein n=1 Tax=Anopheles dirus TaxID=7168 RepID=A0A182NKD2_9DIPT
MDTFGNPSNYQLLLVLAQRTGSLVIYLINHIKREFSSSQESFRNALLPMYRVLNDFLLDRSSSVEQGFRQIRNSGHSFQTIPSMPYPHMNPWESQHLTAAGRVQSFGQTITPPENISPPSGTPPRHWTDVPLGFTSTPLRTPVLRPRPEPFALINQLLVVVRHCEDGNLATVTGHFANNPVFRERLLNELDDLRSFVLAQPNCSATAAGQTLRALLDRVEQAEMTLSSLVQNLRQLEN